MSFTETSKTKTKHLPKENTTKKEKANPAAFSKSKTKCIGAFCVTFMAEQCYQPLASQTFLLMPQRVKDILNHGSRAPLFVRCRV